MLGHECFKRGMIMNVIVVHGLSIRDSYIEKKLFEWVRVSRYFGNMRVVQRIQMMAIDGERRVMMREMYR